MRNTKKDILYLHVGKGTKRWLKALCKKGSEPTSQSAMAERIFKRFKKYPHLLRAA